MKKTLLIICSTLLMLPALAWAVPVQETAAGIVSEAIRIATQSIFTELHSTGIYLLSAFIMLQFFITNFKLIMEGADTVVVFAKFVGSFAWFSICFYIFENGTKFMTDTTSFFYGKAGIIAGASFSPGYVIDYGLSLTTSLLAGVDAAQSALGSLNPFPAILMGVCSVAILVITGLIAFKVFMLIAETSIVIALAPISWAFLGLNALKDQGLVPFKYLIAMAYRAIILGAILAVMNRLGVHIIAIFDGLSTLSEDDIWTPIFATILGYGMLGALAFKADSIATMLSSGTSQMSTGDGAAVAAAAAAAGGVVGGAVVGAGGAAEKVAGAAASGGRAMSDVIKSMGGGGGSITNASSGSGRGGGAPVGDAPKPSMSTNGSAGRGAPRQETGPSPAETAAGARAGSGGKPMDLWEAMEEDSKRMKKDPDSMRDKRNSAVHNGGQPAPGSGATAGIGGVDGAQAPQKDSVGQQPRQAGLAEQLHELNRHVNQENSVVSISLNSNAD